MRRDVDLLIADLLNRVDEIRTTVDHYTKDQQLMNEAANRLLAIDVLEQELEQANKEIESLTTGTKGACYCCEPVATLNVQLSKELQQCQTDYGVLRMSYSLLETKQLGGCMDENKKLRNSISAILEKNLNLTNDERSMLLSLL